jgi:hypothetical protein
VLLDGTPEADESAAEAVKAPELLAPFVNMIPLIVCHCFASCTTISSIPIHNTALA